MPFDLPSIAATTAADRGRLLAQIYGDLAKPGVKQVGIALNTILGLGNTILWPIQLLNDRAKILLEANLEAYRKKVSSIPEDKVIEVPPEIGVPIAEKLTYVSDLDLRGLYTNLLARASSSDTQSQVHPSFISILNSLSPDEAQLLQLFRQCDGIVPFVRLVFFHDKLPDLQKVGRDIHFLTPDFFRIAFPSNQGAYVSNLEGLGLIDVRNDITVPEEEKYLQIESEMNAFIKNKFSPEYSVLYYKRGRINVTPFGWLFIQACT